MKVGEEREINTDFRTKRELLTFCCRVCERERKRDARTAVPLCKLFRTYVRKKWKRASG